MADPVVLSAFAVGSVLSFGLYSDAIPPHFEPERQVEQLYKQDGRIVADATATLLPSTAQSACPNGAQIVREESRVDGNREFLVWTLRCRELAVIR